jgi:tellurite methyltransferase
MREYVPALRAKITLDEMDVLQYPNLRQNLMRYPRIEYADVLVPAAGHLTVEAMMYIGSARKRILDVGCGEGRDALYLAAHGHDVTAMNPHPPKGGIDSLDWAYETAKMVGLELRPVYGSIQDLDDTPERYDVILCNMVLHFLDTPQIPGAVRLLQSRTLPGGLNVACAYTEDNPEQEKTVRGLRSFISTGYLQSLYGQEWRKYRSQEGNIPGWVQRQGEEYADGPVVLIPTVAEIIAKRAISSYMDASRQLQHLY